MVYPLPLPVTEPESNAVDIFYFREVEKAPVSAVQDKKETCNDPELSEVTDIIVKDRPAGNSVSLKGPWEEVEAFCPVRVFAVGKEGDHSAVTLYKNIATATFWT